MMSTEVERCRDVEERTVVYTEKREAEAWRPVHLLSTFSLIFYFELEHRLIS